MSHLLNVTYVKCRIYHMSYKLLNLQKNPKFVQIYKYIKKIQS